MRRVVFWGHLVVAIVIGAVILLKAVTGVVLTAERPVTTWADRAVARIAPAPDDTRLPLDVLAAAASTARSGARVQSVTISSQPDHAAAIGLAGGASIFVNPYTGAVTGESSPRVRAFFSSVLAWHRWFDVDPTNRVAARAVGSAATLGFLFLVLSGVYMWVPRVWTRVRWRFATWFRRGLPSRGRDLNWHHVVGIWSAVPLVVVLGTGIVMSYGWANDWLYRAVGDTPSRVAPAAGGGPRRGAGTDGPTASLAGVDAFVVQASRVAPDWRSIAVRVPTAGARTLTATVDAGDGGQPQLRGTATLDASTGAVLTWEPFSGLSAGRRARSLARYLHTGEALGVPGEIIAALAMIGAVLLVWTGFALAWRRAARWLPQATIRPRVAWPIAAAGVAAAVVGWQMWADGDPAPLASSHVAWLDIAVLVFREGLECVLVLSAVTASFTGATAKYRKPVAAGAAVALVATVGTWSLASRLIDDLAQSVSALAVQAGTGLLAVVVLLVVMNWFFHKVYWTGWIAAHTNRKRVLVDDAARASRSARPSRSMTKVMFGLAMLGFTSLYREGVEVVLFLQSYRLRLGSTPVAWGVAVGCALTAVIAVVTFVMQRRLPYRRMLVLTGVLLGGVLLVMVGEQAQEMQLAGWLPTTNIAWLATRVPSWMGLWFSVFPTVETLVAQALAAALVIGSYFGASRTRRQEVVAPGERTPSGAAAPHAPVAFVRAEAHGSGR